MNKFITLGAIAGLSALILGCNEPTPAPKVQQNVAKAQAERSAEVAQARREGTEAVDAQRRDVADARDQRSYDVAVAKADGDYKVAVEACKALSGQSQADCKDHAAATLKSDKAAAEALKP